MPTQLGQVFLQSILYLKNRSGRKFAGLAICSLSRRRSFGSSRNPSDEALIMSVWRLSQMVNNGEQYIT